MAAAELTLTPVAVDVSASAAEGLIGISLNGAISTSADLSGTISTSVDLAGQITTRTELSGRLAGE